VTALEIIQAFASKVGFPRPSTALANQAEDIQQIVECLNEEGNSLRSRCAWEALNYEVTFTTVATESQGLIADLIGAGQILDSVANNIIWNRTMQVPVMGPESKQQWQMRKALNLTGPYSRYRIRGGALLFNPAPTAGHTCAFEYQSKCGCVDTTGVTFRKRLVADTDEVLLDDDTMQQGLEWRWLRKKGLSYAEEFATYEAMVEDLIQADGTKPVLDMSDTAREPRPGILVPEGNWNL
jgi:hypothetical protein